MKQTKSQRGAQAMVDAPPPAAKPHVTLDDIARVAHAAMLAEGHAHPILQSERPIDDIREMVERYRADPLLPAVENPDRMVRAIAMAMGGLVPYAPI